VSYDGRTFVPDGGNRQYVLKFGWETLGKKPFG
jgi:hypothetical protein